MLCDGMLYCIIFVSAVRGSSSPRVGGAGRGMRGAGYYAILWYSIVYYMMLHCINLHYMILRFIIQTHTLPSETSLSSPQSPPSCAGIAGYQGAVSEGV